jgi:sporulation protein YlmC with PRC-barrel domain
MILVKFNQSGARLQDPDTDVRGLPVTDVNGQDLGHVSDFYFELDSMKVRLLEITSGGFLGLGENQFLVDASDARRVDGSMSIDKSRDEITSMPKGQMVMPVETPSATTMRTTETKRTEMGPTMRPTEPTGPSMGMGGMGRTEERPMGMTKGPLETEKEYKEAQKQAGYGAAETEHKETHHMAPKKAHVTHEAHEAHETHHMAPKKTHGTTEHMMAGKNDDLIGKVVDHRIKASDGTVIMDKGERVSAHYLSKAEKHNAINELRNSVEKRHM